MFAGGGAIADDVNVELLGEKGREGVLEFAGKKDRLFTEPLLLYPVLGAGPVWDGVKVGVSLGAGAALFVDGCNESHDMTSRTSPPAGISLAT
jgi:hypothetical protein